MGTPSINISFTEAATSSMERSERGIVALILKDTSIPMTNPTIVYYSTDIPTSISNFNKEQISLALMGYNKAPLKVICYFLSNTETDYTDALEYLAYTDFDYLAIPTIETDGMTVTVASWIKEQRSSNGKTFKAVLPNTEGDNEGIINFATDSVTDGKTTWTTEKYCSRIAGLIAGTPLGISCTFAPLQELTGCKNLSKSDMDKAVDAGKLIVFFDGEKVKLNRGVNSFVTTSESKGDSFKKIKIVETMDMIYEDIKKAAEDSYLGKYSNSYDNKCLLMSAISSYYETLIQEGVLSSATIEIDIDAQRKYLKGIGIATDSMTADEIKVYNTGSQVFLKSKIKVLDAIEDITLSINI